MNRFILLLTFFSLGCTPALAKGPQSQPAAQSSAADASTPRGALRAWDHSLAKADAKAARSIYHAGSPREVKIVAAMARADLAAARLASLVRQRFGEKLCEDALHAMRQYTASDIDAADEHVKGDTATIEWPDDRPSLEMVKVGGKWKVSAAALLGEDDGEDAVEQIVATNDLLVKELEKTAAELQAGEYSNFVLLDRAIKQRMYRLMGEDD